jgi:uncharacterized protein YajQ (UPF0234 family)
MPSFYIVSKIDMSEVDNALNGIKRETQQRFDLKGTKASVDRNGDVLTVTADNDLQLRQVQELLYTYFARRDVDSKALDFKPTERASGDTLRQMVGIKQGIDGDSGRKIIKAIKATKLKVQVSLQGDELRVTGKKRDDLQEAITYVKSMENDLPLQYVNFRD